MSGTSALRAAVRLAMGGDAAFSPADSAEVVSILATNKVPLVSLAREPGLDPTGEEVVTSPGFIAALNGERARHATLLREYEPVALALEALGIRPVLLKTPAWLPYLSSNLDVLVAPKDFARGARAIEDLGHLRFPHYREDHKLLFRTFSGGAPALSVHLHEAVSWGKIVILPGDRVAAAGRPGEEPGYLVASPADALAATLAHAILETDQVRLSDLRTVRWCLAHGAGVDPLLADARAGRWEAAAASALAVFDAVCREAGGGPLLRDGDRASVDEALAAAPWAVRLLETARPRAGMTLPFLLPRLFSKAHTARVILMDDRREPDVKILDLAASGWNLVANRLRYRCRPARLITVSGPDGAGKSRLASAIEATLSLCEVPARRFWSRGGFTRIAVGGKALARLVVPSALPGAIDEKGKRDFLRAGWRRALWAWAVTLEQAIALQRLRLSLLMGRSVVCDRYVYDSLADLLARLPGEGGDLPAGAAGFLLGAAPVPDVSFMIEVDPSVAHARKEDGTTLDARRDLVRAYRALGEGAPFVRLDGALPFPEMAQAAIEETLRRCFAAFEGRGR